MYDCNRDCHHSRAWIHDNASSTVLKLTRRIEDMTGLDTALHSKASCAEDFQVASVICNILLTYSAYTVEPGN